MDNTTPQSNNFGELYKEQYPKIYRYLLYRVGYDKNTAYDLTQETFLRALQHMDSFKNMGHGYHPYLMTIAHNLLVNYYKKTKNISWSTLEDRIKPAGEMPLEQVLSENYDELGDIIKHEDLERSISHLSPSEQKIIHMKYAEGLRTREIAAKIHRTELATKLFLYRTRN